MTCVKCEELCVRYAIRQPHELRKAIDIARQNIEDGTIVEIPNDNSLSQVSFSELASGATWDDIVEHYFRCSYCGEEFTLHAETYHGTGGYWEPKNNGSVRENL